ncbi:protein lethal(2)denticleless [Venturia canescens]|uniref:protein lethal(2)denticleless n=1 Tax=Venturia canescens TaxID=32260 RepID=UPI001C9D0C1C|nr:protein lethal(2)denticleless [Venturia canescens]
MNVVDALTRRCAGFESISDYDIALSRLKCHEDDVYRGIAPDSNEAEYAPDRPVFACRFCNVPEYNQFLALANEDGRIALQDTSKKGQANQQLKGVQAHRNAIFDIAWMPGEMKLVTASGDHTARLWNLTQPEVRMIESYSGHTRGVKTAVFRPQDKAVFATGARDGAIMLWDIRASHTPHAKPDNCIWTGHGNVNVSSRKYRRGVTTASRAQSITGLAFQDDFSLLSCGAGDGFIKVWDMRKIYTVHKKEPLPKHVMNYTGGSVRNGFTMLLVCPAGISLYASCMDNIIYEYNISSYNPKPVAEYYGHRNSTFYVKTCLSPDGKYLASGSSDEYAYIWSTKKPGSPLIKLWGHTDEVTCIDWCNMSEPKIVTCSDDCCHRVWRVGLEHKGENDDIEIRGQAQTVQSTSPLEQASLETTPTVSRRWVSQQQRTPGSDITPTTTPDASGSARDRSNESEGPVCRGSTSKRTYVQMMARGPWTDGKFKSVLSPIVENLEPTAKRVHVENRGARRLFSPIREEKEESSVSSSASVSLQRGYESDEPGPSSSSCGSEVSRQMPFSPTLNLPNYVIDGTAPHLVQRSPQKCKENIDWLTKIRRERYELRVGRADTEKSITSPNAHVTPARRTRRSRSTEPRKLPKNPAVSLLNFFRVSSKDSDKEYFSVAESMTQTSTESKQ